MKSYDLPLVRAKNSTTGHKEKRMQIRILEENIKMRHMGGGIIALRERQQAMRSLLETHMSIKQHTQ